MASRVLRHGVPQWISSLSHALLDDERYREVSDRLRDRGFEPGKTDDGRVTRQTWVLQASSIPRGHQELFADVLPGDRVLMVRNGEVVEV